MPMDKRTKQVKTNIQRNEWGHDSVEIIIYLSALMNNLPLFVFWTRTKRVRRMELQCLDISASLFSAMKFLSFFHQFFIRSH